MTTLLTDEDIAAMEPSPTRNKNVYLSRGLVLTVRPAGKKVFEVRAMLKRGDGWTKPIRRMLGEWPEMSLDVARMQARHYVELAGQGIDFRRTKEEVAARQAAYLAERHAATRTERERRALMREVERQARAEAKRMKAEEAKRKLDALAALREVEAKIKREAAALKVPTHKPRPRAPQPEPTQMAPRRTLFDMPWGK